MKRKILWFSSTAVFLCILMVVFLLSWWNTDLLGRERFCDGMFSSSEVDAALQGSGRLKQGKGYEEGSYFLRCELKRTSKFLGSPQPRVEVSIEFADGDDPFQSPVWQNRERMSFTKSGLAGGATKKRAWVLLPSECWGKIPARKDSIPFVTTELSEGGNQPESSDVSTSPDALMRLTYRAAQRILKNVQCSTHGVRQKTSSGSLHLASAHMQRSHSKKLCGKPGLSLPTRALPTARTKVGAERRTSEDATVWSCDLYLQSQKRPSLTFSVSANQDVVEAVKKQKVSAEWDNGKVAGCKQGDLYIGLFAHDSYIEEFERGGKDYNEIIDDLLSSFVQVQERDSHWDECVS
ncbi:hypothetical protein [Streptomyces sp. 891-h]|uniref:hypothetical protein n=1 Tax=unclassified Streptomyces TaxID=2593676 RepID=UPI001FAA11E7|nr:hypothetical protein [Streptomyces sp. 891-h]UNZ19107.1 hypothetical protein HC362_20700 [Streptomyces sp. 891-h]